MARVGRYSLILGLILTVIGLVFGFGYMFADQDEMAKLFLTFVPVGFLITFAGLATVILFSEENKRK